MFRHLFIAALRNMAANRLLSAISILGLTIGLTAAILMALVIRNQLSFDHFIPGYERTYTGISALTRPGAPTDYANESHREMAELLKLGIPEIESSARVLDRTAIAFQHGDIRAKEEIYWADPNIFDLLPLPVLHGDLKTALRRPDSVVLPRSVAQKYFGRDDVVGQTINVDFRPMMVAAVIEDLPANTTELETGIFASFLSPKAPFYGAKPDPKDSFLISVRTYVRLKPAVSIDAIRARAEAIVANRWPKEGAGMITYAMPLARIDRVNLDSGLNPAIEGRLAVAGLVGVLTLLIAAINFINLLTARAARRATEVGIRKASGASRPQLMAQFLGESIITVFLAAALAVLVASLLLAPMNVFLQTGAMLDDWRNPLAILLLLAGIIMLGILSGAYPAFVLSAFQPASVLKGFLAYSRNAGVVRNGLVVLQFTILIALVIAAGVVWQQRVFATQDALRVPIDKMLIVTNARCLPGYKAELRKLPGVRAVSCTTGLMFGGENFTVVPWRGGKVVTDTVQTEFGIFPLYGIKPLAGSFATLAPNGDASDADTTRAVVNETLVKRYGFASPAAAIGQVIPLPGYTGPDDKPLPPVRIFAVVPDFSFHSVTEPVKAVLYRSNAKSDNMGYINIKLAGTRIPEILAATDRLWAATGNQGTPNHYFLDEHIQQQYLAMLREAQLFAIFGGVAVFLACLGLFGLSISTAERRIKEIGVRKAMGASSADIVRLLLWQFTRPVLWANLIAWPLAWWLMRRWLSGFAYHVELGAWPFVGATLLAVVVALLTVTAQAVTIARAVPATSLRYE